MTARRTATGARAALALCSQAVLGLAMLGLAMLGLAACRLETAPPESEAPSAPGSLAEAGPPVQAGDTVRVTPDEAARARLPDAPAVPAPSVAPSGLVVPVVGVAPADLVDTFEAARSEGRTHNALDILAPRGTPVVAATDGRVLRLFTSDKGGLTVYQLGADERTVYYYAHLDAYAPDLEAGQALRRGDPVGTVGDSGNATPGNTHLHFAIWTVRDAAQFWDGEPVNPYDRLAPR